MTNFIQKTHLDIGFSAFNCLLDSQCSLLTSQILGSCSKLKWSNRAYAVYWLRGTLLYPWLEAQKRERVKKAEKRKEAFKKKQAEKTRFEDSNNVRKRKDFTAIPQECKNCPMVGWASRLWVEVIELKIRGQDQVQMSSF